MKTIRWILLAALQVPMTCTVLAQASFHLLNYNPFYGIDAPVFEEQGVPLVGPRYLAELWGGATQDSLMPAIIYSGQMNREIVPFGTGGHFISGSGFLSIAAVPPNGWA